VVFAGYFYRTLVLNQETDYGFAVFACLLLLASSAIAVIRVYSWTGATPLKVAILVLLLFDFHLFLTPHMKLKKDFDGKGNYEPKQYYFHDELIDFLRSQTGTFRVDFGERFRPGNPGQVYKLETVGGHGATALKRFSEFQANHYPVGNVIGDLMNVRFIVSRDELPLSRVFSNKNGIVYENPDWLPRAWLVDEVIPKTELEEVLPLLLLPSFNPRAVAYIEGSDRGPGDLPKPALTSSRLPLNDSLPPVDDVTFARKSPNWFVVEVRTMRPRFLVVSENWYPGWKVETDGKPQALYRVDGALMGVFVDPGYSKIEFRYRPTGFYLALSLILLSLVSLAVTYSFSRNKKSRKP
jgi:hypothetical protein